MQGATAIALQPPDPGVRRPRLAVAQRVSKRSMRVAVLEVQPGTGLGTRLHAPPAVTLSQADLPEPLLVKVGATQNSPFQPCTPQGNRFQCLASLV